jgi:hypothetical protein
MRPTISDSLMTQICTAPGPTPERAAECTRRKFSKKKKKSALAAHEEARLGFDLAIVAGL